MVSEALFEIVGRYDGREDCSALLYAPGDPGLTYQASRVYRIEYDGELDAVRGFVERALFDGISQEMREGEGTSLEGFAFYIDYGMKPGALDLEKEAIVGSYRGLGDPGFELKSLRIRQRVYVFGEEADPAPFVRDVCNAAIHHWEVISG